MCQDPCLRPPPWSAIKNVLSLPRLDISVGAARVEKFFKPLKGKKKMPEFLPKTLPREKSRSWFQEGLLGVAGILVYLEKSRGGNKTRPERCKMRAVTARKTRYFMLMAAATAGLGKKKTEKILGIFFFFFWSWVRGGGEAAAGWMKFHLVFTPLCRRSWRGCVFSSKGFTISPRDFTSSN